MIKACTAERMRLADKAATEYGGVPGIVLMENAGLACVRELEKLGVSGKRVAVFCGKGNNGGDGFVIARHLLNMGVDCEIFLVSGNNFSGDALINYEILEKMGTKFSHIDEDEDLKYKILSFDIVVDAIFGTGISGEITGVPKTVIEAINEYARFVLSVDIPSGVNADNGSIAGVAVKADMTVTFAAYKLGMLAFPGADCCGKIKLSDISIPEYILEDINTNIIDEAFAKSLMPRRCDNSHKGDYGKLLIIGGSKGMTGAPAMAAEAAIKCGCGLVSVAIPESLNAIMEVKLTEAMTIPMSDSDGAFSEEATEKLISILGGYDAVCFGPGIGRSDAIGILLSEILKVSKVPVLIDADGLYALSKNPEMLENCGCDVILTPHEAEFARLINSDAEDVRKNRLSHSLRFCDEFGVVLVLKGSKTVVTAPTSEQYINIKGNNGMATGGSGDVLSGMIGAYLARGMSAQDSAVLGVFCHASAGDKAAETVGKDSLSACDIIDAIHLILPLE